MASRVHAKGVHDHWRELVVADALRMMRGRLAVLKSSIARARL
jgi:hypothetical protein